MYENYTLRVPPCLGRLAARALCGMGNVLLLHILLTVFLPLQADEEVGPLTLSVTSIKGLMDEEVPGPYNIIYQAIERNYSGEIKVTMRPIRRAFRMFFSGESDCYFIGTGYRQSYVAEGLALDKILISEGIQTVTIRLYTRPSDAIIMSLDMLKNSELAIDVAVGASDYFRENIMPVAKEFFFVQSLDKAIDLLEDGRVDAVLAVDYDMASLIRRRPEAKKYQFSSAFSTFSTQDSFVCWRSAKTESFIESVNATLNGLRKNGKLESILHPNKIPSE